MHQIHIRFLPKFFALFSILLVVIGCSQKSPEQPHSQLNGSSASSSANENLMRIQERLNAELSAAASQNHLDSATICNRILVAEGTELNLFLNSIRLARDTLASSLSECLERSIRNTPVSNLRGPRLTTLFWTIANNPHLSRSLHSTLFDSGVDSSDVFFRSTVVTLASHYPLLVSADGRFIRYVLERLELTAPEDWNAARAHTWSLILYFRAINRLRLYPQNGDLNQNFYLRIQSRVRSIQFFRAYHLFTERSGSV